MGRNASTWRGKAIGPPSDGRAPSLSRPAREVGYDAKADELVFGALLLRRCRAPCPAPADAERVGGVLAKLTAAFGPVDGDSDDEVQVVGVFQCHQAGCDEVGRALRLEVAATQSLLDDGGVEVDLLVDVHTRGADGCLVSADGVDGG